MGSYVIVALRKCVYRLKRVACRKFPLLISHNPERRSRTGLRAPGMVNNTVGRANQRWGTRRILTNAAVPDTLSLLQSDRRFRQLAGRTEKGTDATLPHYQP